MLGYGALGRETARLLKANGMNIIAANTTGKASTDPEVNNSQPAVSSFHMLTMT
jgi:phosphoglycerate dehydrogenase-like enzyme